MKSNQIIEAVFELEGTGDTCAAAIANHLGGSVVDAITICVKLEKDHLIAPSEEGYGLTAAGVKHMEVLTA